MAHFEAMDRPLSRTPATDERGVWVERHPIYGHILINVEVPPSLGGGYKTIATVNVISKKITLIADGADGTGTSMKRNATGHVVVETDSGDINGPAVN